MKINRKRLPIMILMLALFLVSLSACSLNHVLRAAPATPLPPISVQVSADQIAAAMQADEFFSDFRSELLLVTGKVSAVNQTGNTTQIELETSLPTKVRCDLSAPASAIKPGDQITVKALAADAERAPAAVLLKKCAVQ